MKIRKLIVEHFDFLKVQEDGDFPHRGQDIPKAHLLRNTEYCRHRNILERYRHHFWSSIHSQIKPHRYIHHLNPSRAISINRFYPRMSENRLGFIWRYLDITPKVYLNADFEQTTKIEKAVCRTSLDFSVQFDASCKTFPEAKYSENGFGKLGDIRHENETRNEAGIHSGQ